MRLFALVFLLASVGQAAISPGTVGLYYFDNNPNDSSGNGYNLTDAGTTPYVTSPTPKQGTHIAGTFTDANYFDSPAGLDTAMSSLSAWTVEFWAYYTSRANSPVMFSYANGVNNFFQVANSSPYERWNTGGASNVDVTTDYTGINAWHHIALVCRATNDKEMWIDGTLVGENTNNASSGTVTSFYIGRYIGGTGFSVSGYIDQLRFSNIARSSFPTSDSSTPTQQRSPWLRNRIRLQLGEMFRNPFFVSELHAMSENQIVERWLNDERAAFIASKKAQGLAMKPEKTFTPHPTPTVSPTPSPTPRP